MSPYVIRYQGLVGRAAIPGRVPIGAYLRSFDVEAHDGRGEANWTMLPQQAMKFRDAAAATWAWRTRSAKRPNRPDGRPNRPLTAFNVAIEPLEGTAHESTKDAPGPGAAAEEARS